MARSYHYRQQTTEVGVAGRLAQVVHHLPLIGAGFGILLGINPALAEDGYPSVFSPPRNRFDNCTLDLIQRKVSPENAAQACAQALRPEDLRQCVVQIAGSGQLAPQDILNACRQVRRPVEMAECVNNLRRNLKDAVETEILNSCSLSLLPTRFSYCVRGLSKATEISSTLALNECNNGGNDARELAPSFIPYTVLPSEQIQIQPTTPDLLKPTPATPAPTVPAPTQSTPAPLPQKF